MGMGTKGLGAFLSGMGQGISDRLEKDYERQQTEKVANRRMLTQLILGDLEQNADIMTPDELKTRTDALDKITGSKAGTHATYFGAGTQIHNYMQSQLPSSQTPAGAAKAAGDAVDTVGLVGAEDENYGDIPSQFPSPPQVAQSIDYSLPVSQRKIDLQEKRRQARELADIRARGGVQADLADAAMVRQRKRIEQIMARPEFSSLPAEDQQRMRVYLMTQGLTGTGGLDLQRYQVVGRGQRANFKDPRTGEMVATVFNPVSKQYTYAAGPNAGQPVDVEGLEPWATPIAPGMVYTEEGGVALVNRDTPAKQMSQTSASSTSVPGVHPRKPAMGVAQLSPSQMRDMAKSVATRVAAGEISAGQGLALMGGSRGGGGYALVQELDSQGVRVVPEKIREQITNIQKAKNLLVPIEDLMNKIIAGQDVATNSVLLENYSRSIGTMLSRSLGERGVVTDQDVARAIGIVPGWKASNFAPDFARKEMAYFKDLFARQEEVLTTSAFNPISSGTTPAKPKGAGKGLTNPPSSLRQVLEDKYFGTGVK